MKRRLRAATVFFCLSAGTFTGLKAQSFDWAQQSGWGDDNQYGLDVAADDSGNVYNAGFVTGYTTIFDQTGDVEFDNTGSSTTEDGFVVKYDKNGLAEWVIQVGSTGNDRCVGVSSYQNGPEDPNIYVTGTFNGTATITDGHGSTSTITSSGGQDAYIAKFDGNGNFIWAYDIGGSGTDYAYDVSGNADNQGHSHVLYIAGRNASGTGMKCYYSGGSYISPVSYYSGEAGYLLKYVDNGTTGTASWIRITDSSNPDSYYCVGSSTSQVSVGGYIRGNATVQANGSGGTSSLTLSGAYDIAVASYDVSGTLVWTHRYGGSSLLTENATCLTMDNDNNTYVGGYYGYSGSPFSCNNGGWEGLVMAIDPSGTTLWNSCGGSSGDDYVSGIAIDKCSKHVYVGGIYKGSFTWGSASLSPFNSTADNDNFMLTLDASDGSYMSGTANRLGGIGNDVLYAMTANGLNHIYLTGTSTSGTWKIGSTSYFTNSNTPTGNYDAFIGRWIDGGSYPSKPSSGSASHRGVDVLDCDVYAGGTMTGSVTFGSVSHTSTNNSIGNPSDDIYMTKSDRFGTYNSFVQVAYGTSNEDMTGQVQDASGNLYLSGYANTGSAGNGVTFNTSPSATTVTFTNGGPQAMVCQTDPNGVTQWYAFGIAGSGAQAWANDVALDASGNVYICGSFQGTVTFGSTNLTASSQEDAFIAKYNSSGTLQWAKDVANGTSSGITVRAFGICVDGSGYVYITGTYGGLTQFNGNMVSIPLNAGSNGNDIFVAQYDASGWALKALGYAGSTGWDEGRRVTAVNSQAIYVTGYSNISSQKTFTGKCTMSSTPSWSWTKNATGSLSYGQGIVTDGTDLYVTGYGNNGTVFGSFTLSLSYGSPFLVRYNGNNGTEEYASAREVGSYAGGMAIALDDETPDNAFIAGTYPTLSSYYAFIDQLSTSNGNYARHANPFTVQPAQDNSAISSASVFPNPSYDGILNVKIDGTTGDDAPASILIYDLTGQLVLRKDGITTAQEAIDAGMLDDGTYLYEVVRENNRIGNGKIVIAK